MDARADRDLSAWDCHYDVTVQVRLTDPGRLGGMIPMKWFKYSTNQKRANKTLDSV